MTLSHCDYENLLIEFRNGDSGSRDRLAENIQNDIRPYVYRMLFDQDLADEITQETQLKAFELMDTIRNPGAFRAWLYRMALGRVQLHFRKRKRLEIPNIDMLNEAISHKAVDGLSKLIQKELSGAIMKAIGSLKVSQRNILILRIFQGLSFKEIADILDCSALTAKVRFYRAREVLKRKLKGYGFHKSMLLPALALFGQLTAEASGVAVLPVITGKTLMVSTGAAILGSHLLVYLAAPLVLLLPVLSWQSIKETVTGYSSGQRYQMQISAPAKLISVQHNNDQIDGNQQYRPLASIDKLNQYFTQENFKTLNVVIKPGESVEFEFPGVIANGAGDDIFITELGPAGESVEVYLRDRQGNELYLGLAESPRIGRNRDTAIINYPINCTFDLAKYNLDFEPVSIKLTGPHTGGVPDGFELHRLQARVKIPEGLKP